MIDNFVKNWEAELKSRAQKCKRKPSITIIKVGDAPGGEMLERSKRIGFAVDLYDIPIDSGITNKDLRRLVMGCNTDEIYVEEPLPEGFENPLITGRYMEKGILTFLKSQNIDPLGWRIILAFATDDKYEAHIGDIVFYKEQTETLEQMAILEEGIERVESE